MIAHSFKIMWNQKRKYGFILFELFIIFVVIFMTSLYMIDNFNKYIEGIGGDTENVYFMNIEKTGNDAIQPNDHFIKIKSRIKNITDVESVSISYSGSPYIDNYVGSVFTHGENRTRSRIRYVDQDFPSVLKPELVNGSWFDNRSNSTLEIPVVIDKTMAKELIGEEDPLGKIIREKKQKYRIIGVINHFKNSDYDQSRPVIFVPFFNSVTEYYDEAAFLIRYKEGTHPKPAAYSEEIFSVISKEKYSMNKCSKLESMKEQANSNIGGDIVFVSLVVGFLLFNLVLGLIGILGYNVNQRWSEMGIRRAVGSTQKSVRRLIFFEMLALTVMAILPAFLAAVQIPAFEIMPLDWPMFIQAMLFSLALIFIMVTISVLYPGIMAAKIRPAVALKEE